MENATLALPIENLLRGAANVHVQQSMRQLYADLDDEIANQPGHCWISAACCKFDGPHDHRLFVTAIEVCYYLSMHVAAPVDVETCPHLVGQLCRARDARPLGCRIFYCDPKAQHWQGTISEIYLSRLRELHVDHGVHYFYADWLIVLRRLQDYFREQLPVALSSAHVAPPSGCAQDHAGPGAR